MVRSLIFFILLLISACSQPDNSPAATYNSTANSDCTACCNPYFCLEFEINPDSLESRTIGEVIRYLRLEDNEFFHTFQGEYSFAIKTSRLLKQYTLYFEDADIAKDNVFIPPQEKVKDLKLSGLKIEGGRGIILFGYKLQPWNW